MNRDQLIGGIMMVAALIGIVIYAWIMFFTEWYLLLLELTAFIAVAGVLGIIAWIGYTLATTPSPKPIEEIEKELQKEMELLEKKSGEKEESQPE